MPFSGEMRLRQLILAVFALAGIWVGLAVQHARRPPAPAAFAAGPAAPDFPAPAAEPCPNLVGLAGLNRPASAVPIAVNLTPRPYVHAPGGPAARPARVR